jgi:hypothetical protein
VAPAVVDLKPAHEQNAKARIARVNILTTTPYVPNGPLDAREKRLWRRGDVVDGEELLPQDVQKMVQRGDLIPMTPSMAQIDAVRGQAEHDKLRKLQEEKLFVRRSIWTWSRRNSMSYLPVFYQPGAVLNPARTLICFLGLFR